MARKKITPVEIKNNNRKQIYDYIYKHGKVSQNDIAAALRLSRPTIATNVAELEEDGLIFKDGQQDSDQIGRKAAAYSIAADYRIAIGVELTGHHIKVIPVDLYGRKLSRTVWNETFINTDEYYSKACSCIKEVIDSLDVSDERILGVGIAMQGLVSPDGNTIIYGKIMNCTGVTIDKFTEHLNYRCTFIHDPEGAALSELWASPELNSAVYLSMSEHLGGAMIVNRNVFRGRSGHSATFEHIQIDPNGKQCYCGKKGCFETVLSMKALLDGREADEFFDAVRSGSEPEKAKWQEYLKNLAIMIDGIHLVNDIDYILGGHLAPYFTEEDIKILYDNIRRICPFEEEDGYIKISKMPSHNINIGAALPYIKEFLDNPDNLRPERSEQQ